MGVFSVRNGVIVAVLVAALVYEVKKIHCGQVGMMKAMIGYEKYGKYGEKTADEIVQLFNGNFADTVSIVTGANTGIGLETARVIGKHGGHVVMACRTPARCEKGKAKIETDVAAGGGKLQCMQVDLSSLASVDKFVADFEATGLKLQYLVNNAGIMALPKYQETAQGIEKQWGVNHLGHFRLTTLLLNKLKAFGTGARIINLSSLAHLWWTVDAVPAPLTKETYNDEAAYGISKASNVLFSLGLRKRLAGTGVVTTSVHPGLIVTELLRHNEEMMEQFNRMFDHMKKYLGFNPMKTIPQGAATTLMAMLDALPDNGDSRLYYSDSQPGVSPGNYYDHIVSNPAHAEGLWKLSEKYVLEYEKAAA